MAFAFLSHVVADLTLGKPALFWLPSTASVRDALRALTQLGDDVSEISIWECVGGDDTDLEVFACRFHGDYVPSGSRQSCDSHGHCCCIGKLIAEGAQNLVVPITGHTSKFNQESKGGFLPKHAVKQNSGPPLQRSHNGQAYCWLTHEDVLRFLLGSIRVFSPLPTMSIEDLGIIQTNICIVGVNSEAITALEMIKAACLEMTAVAVVENADDVSGELNLVGDISCNTLQTCNETAALALATLSVGDFLVYVQDCGNSAHGMADLIRARLYEKLSEIKGGQHMHAPFSKSREVNLFLQDLEMWDESSSDGEESGADSPTGPHDFSQKWLSMHLRASRTGYSAKSRSGPIFCNPKSSLVAVLLQALAHREHYVWVTGENSMLLGIVTFSDVLNVMLNHVNI